MFDVATVAVESNTIDSLNESSVSAPDRQVEAAEEMLDELAMLHECGMPTQELAARISEETGLDHELVLQYIS